MFVGITVFIDILTIGEESGASMNPIRALGPSIVDLNPYFDGFWIYLTAPILGSILGAIYHDYFIHDHKVKYSVNTNDNNDREYKRIQWCLDFDVIL